MESNSDINTPPVMLHTKNTDHLTLKCKHIHDKNNKQLYLCSAKESDIENIKYEDLINDPIQPIRDLDGTNKNKNSVSLVILSSLIGGFGFAVAYFILYALYDFFAYDSFSFNLTRFFISFGILMTLLIGLVLITYFIFRKKQSDVD